MIQNDYDAMREHDGPVGDLFTYGFSAMADNPIPSGQAYRDYDPIVLRGEWDTPEVGAHVTLPLPAGNLSNFDDRWGWIENDMLPHYRELLRDPDATRALVSTPVADRAGDFCKLPDPPYPGG